MNASLLPVVHLSDRLLSWLVQPRRDDLVAGYLAENMEQGREAIERAAAAAATASDPERRL
jgi:hypothetical protein